MDGRFETALRPGLGFAAWPTNDDLTLVIAGCRSRVRGRTGRTSRAATSRSLEIAPAFAERVRGAKREERFVGTAVPQYFRKPFGPGWALVGDAGYNKDFITAQGIHDAFRDAELCATALDEAFAGPARVRGRHARVPGASRRAGPADVRVHRRARDARAPAARAAAAAERGQRQPGGDGRVRARRRRSGRHRPSSSRTRTSDASSALQRRSPARRWPTRGCPAGSDGRWDRRRPRIRTRSRPSAEAGRTPPRAPPSAPRTPTPALPRCGRAG